MKSSRISIASAVLILLVVSLFVGCQKADEVPPRVPRYEKEYILPPPAFLTQEERELVSQKRAEYNAL